MKKINAWINKLLGVGTGEFIERFKVINGVIQDWPYFTLKGLKDGTMVIIDHNKQTVTFKKI